MNGIEKITARIAADAETEIRNTQADAAARCAEIKAEYDRKAQEEYWALVQAGVKDTEQRVQRLGRTARLEAKKSLLAMKQEVVSEAFELARKKIIGLPEPAYVAFLASQAAQAAVSGQEEILLNEPDRARCGAKVVKAANELLKKRGVQPALTLGEGVRPISGGLILRQGDIEVNCTVDTLLELARGELAAQVAEVLFPAEA
jgi:V/A-type H+-transporting ATPase subunit E